MQPHLSRGARCHGRRRYAELKWENAFHLGTELVAIPGAGFYTVSGTVKADGSISQAVVKVSTACEARRSAPRRLGDTEISYGFLGVSAFSVASTSVRRRGNTLPPSYDFTGVGKR